MKKLLLISSLAFVFAACSKDEVVDNTIAIAEATESTKYDLKGANLTEELNIATEDVAVSNDAYVSSPAARKYIDTQAAGTQASLSYLPSGTVVTINSTANERQFIVDFGTTGLTAKNGHVYKGQMTIYIQKNADGSYKTTTISNNDANCLYIDGNKYVGSVITTRSLVNNIPHFVRTVDFVFTNTSGIEYKRTANWVVDLVEGYATKDCLDDVYNIAKGSYANTQKTGAEVFKMVVNSYLVKKVAYKYITQGVQQFSYKNKIYIIDYGMGENDNKASLTVNGTTLAITL